MVQFYNFHLQIDGGKYFANAVTLIPQWSYWPVAPQMHKEAGRICIPRQKALLYVRTVVLLQAAPGLFPFTCMY